MFPRGAFHFVKFEDELARIGRALPERIELHKQDTEDEPDGQGEDDVVRVVMFFRDAFCPTFTPLSGTGFTH